MCTCAAGKGHEKSQRLIRESVSGYVIALITKAIKEVGPKM
jgi:hypothetical protein